MNDKTRQLLILFALLLFLSTITIFHVRMTNPYPESADYNNTVRNNTVKNDSGIQFEKREGNDLLTQSINGLIDLYRDLNKGMEFLRPQETRSG